MRRGRSAAQGCDQQTGSDPVAFTLPAGLRPTTAVYVRVDLCNAADGRLFIQPNGVVTVQAENSFSDVQRFTSLDGPRLSGDPRDAARL